MKKIIALLSILLLVGCGDLSNTPTKQTEAFFKKYQTLDNAVLSDLNDVLANDTTLTDSQKEEYRNIMKKHYQNLTYEVKEAIENGDEATVKTEIVVTDFNKALDEANSYLLEHPEEFNDEFGNYNVTKFNDYRIQKLKEAQEKVKYTLDITLTKKDSKWQVDKQDDSILDKINGTYNY